MTFYVIFGHCNAIDSGWYHSYDLYCHCDGIDLGWYNSCDLPIVASWTGDICFWYRGQEIKVGIAMG